MKIERIAPNKIKVSLSPEDLKEWDVSFESLTYNSPEAQDLFWSLIRRAEVEAGFYAEGSQLVIEAMPGKNDGFVMIITRVEDDEEQLAQKYIKPKMKRETRPRKKLRTLSNPMIFRFFSFDDVVEACKHIETRFYGLSSLYKYQELYYLSFDISNEFVSEDLDLLLTDFAAKEAANPAVKAGELAEHGMLMVEEKAVESLCKHF